MESSWTKVRQAVANRVLSRHLQDLHEQKDAMETTQSQHKKRELRASRNRAASLHPDGTDPLVAVTSRRRSMPVSPRLLPTASPSRPPTRRVARASGAQRGAAAGDGGDDEGDPPGNLLDLMASTLHTARATEQLRPHLHLHPSTVLPGSGRPRGKAPSSPGTAQIREPAASAAATHRLLRAASSSFSKSQPAARALPPGAEDSAASPRRPRLERGETFLELDQSQVLSLDEGPEEEEKDSRHRKAARGKARNKALRRQKKDTGSATREGLGHAGSGTRDDNNDVGAESSGAAARAGNVKVDFYDENTGLRKDDGGFTPKDLTLALDMLQEEDEELTHNGDTVGEEEEEGEDQEDDDDDEEAGEEEEEEDDPWSEVRKCQYIRGYDPPQMRMPKDTVKFVFGSSR